MHHSHSKHHKGKVSYLESAERRKEFSPDMLFNSIPVKETANIVDFGAGTGYFTIPAVERTKGNVYALDQDVDMVEIIKEKAMEKQLANIVPILGSMESLPVTDSSIDIIIASLVLHEIKPLGPILKQMKSVLASDGYLVCLELKPKESSERAPRVTMEGMEREMIEAGFKVTEKFFPSESLYALIVRKVN
ncbi:MULTISPECIES: class I SAM-dependent methyltransferase [unclassified Sporosarcina]|uniref:class I SAM-dependent methyltransferase n=1 Tax=unclassified Sporosarcina TaxID=2647733 RepID=UPI0020409528|nr:MULTISPECIES: class I SAM-dependent methyltransferase [unclassified Sporosarcina]GKV67446.1 SAM-dependent methyltransferase [Sporosarcina sp. NCCP-2331]GLB57801.1 SAM-dependent methyltransferase [Sporosarcina sp. NCCP-2378]